MAFCLRNFSDIVIKKNNVTHNNCKSLPKLLRNSLAFPKSLRQVTFSAPLSRSGYSDVYKVQKGSFCGRMPTKEQRLSPHYCPYPTSLLAQLTTDQCPINRSLVYFSDVMERDPLGLLLHSNLQASTSVCPVMLPATAHYAVDNSTYSSRGLPHQAPGASVMRSARLCADGGYSLSNKGARYGDTPGHSNMLSASCGLSCGAVASSTTTLLCSSQPTPTPGGGLPPQQEGSLGRLPTEEQLQDVHDTLLYTLSNFFTKPYDFRIYDPNIVFENRIQGRTSEGIQSYALQMYLFKIMGHFRNVHVKFHILKITKHPEEGTIKIRWRVKSIQTMTALKGGVFRMRHWGKADVPQEDESHWYDGFSTFSVSSKGLVTRHVVDNMMPDEQKLFFNRKLGLTSKLAVLFGLYPKPGHGSAMEGLALNTY